MRFFLKFHLDDENRKRFLRKFRLEWQNRERFLKKFRLDEQNRMRLKLFDSMESKNCVRFLKKFLWIVKTVTGGSRNFKKTRKTAFGGEAIFLKGQIDYEGFCL